jgi:hypothetical protein
VIKFDKPENLNGAELLAELAAVEIILDPITQPLLLDGNGDFWININPADEAKAAVVVAAHNGTTIAPEPTIADKLASVGLDFEELKAAILGGGN